MKSLRAVGVALLLLSAAGPAAAQLVVGTTNTANCYPFICMNFDGNSRYQQIYGASAFSGPLTFNTLTFFDTEFPGSVIASGNYLIRFATVGFAVDGLTSSADVNLGANAATFFSGALNGGLSITGNSYTYNPLDGNLLMDVSVTGQTAGYGTYFDANSSGSEMSRYYGNATGYTDSYALVTQFSSASTSTVTPEPATILLLATGLLALGLITRRRLGLKA